MDKKMLIQYSSNNSGGRWWLADEDWFALEAAGWEVDWFGKQKPVDLNGKTFSFRDTEDDTRWLGALAKSAKKRFSSVADAIREFEAITGQDASDEGCNCCGAPHTFYWGRAADDSLPKDAEYGYASGEQVLSYLFGSSAPKSLREALEKGGG